MRHTILNGNEIFVEKNFLANASIGVLEGEAVAA